MQEHRTLQDDQVGAQPNPNIHSQAIRRLKEYRLKRIILGALAGLALVVAGIFGFQALIGEQTALETTYSAPVDWVEEDPPLPAHWVDPYFALPPAHPAAEDPPLPEGWVDPYFSRPIDLPVQEDPPLPEGWVDPYFRATD